MSLMAHLHWYTYSSMDGLAIGGVQRAMKVVRELLTETPELAKDLLGLLQMVDDGEVAVIGGIENRRIRSKLKELFPLLGLVKVGLLAGSVRWWRLWVG